jgi:periplasmic protein TonB
MADADPRQGMRFRPAKRRLHRVDARLAASADAPYAAVLDIGDHETVRRHWLVVAALIALYGGVVSVALIAPREPIAVAPQREVPVTTIAAPEPPPPPPPQPPPPEPPPVQAQRTPPAAAQTAKALTRSDDSKAPVDLSDFDLVVGHAESYAGGVSSATGTNTSAVSTLAARGSVPVARPRSSQARTAMPGRADWSCAWPEAEDQSDRREARVAIRVTVATDGRPEKVEVVGSPEASFAEAARVCALRERFTPGLDGEGRRVQSQTPPFVVHFVR